MKILGIPIKNPTVEELAIAAVCVAVFAGIGAVLGWAGMMQPESVRLFVLAGSVGILGNTFGISMHEYGVRAAALIVLLGLIALPIILL